MVRLDQIADVAGQFVLVRLGKITGADLHLFDFDYDLTWMAFFLSTEETMYGRYGSRGAKSVEERLSLAGLRYAMKAALAAHRRRPKDRPALRRQAPLRAEDFPAAKPLLIRGACIHCHQVREFQRAQLKKMGKWQRAQAWVYPLPENIGLILDIDRGNRVRSVAAGSPAHGAGLRPGDLLHKVNGIATASLADVQYGLHKAPAAGSIPISWSRESKQMSAALKLKQGWRKTDLTWRPSMRSLVPSLRFRGDDLSVAEKKALRLSAGRLAFRQGNPVDPQAGEMGLRAKDIIIGMDRYFPAMTMSQFLNHVRRNYLVGDRAALHILRGGKRINLALTLR